jgi:hypothetical protein
MATFVEEQSLNTKNEGFKSRPKNKLFRVTFVLASPSLPTQIQKYYFRYDLKFFFLRLSRSKFTNHLTVHRYEA